MPSKASAKPSNQASLPAPAISQFPSRQALSVIYEHRDFINAADGPSGYYAQVPCQRRAYEVSGIAWSMGDARIDESRLASVMDGSLAVSSFRPYEWRRPNGSTVVEKRLIYRKDRAAEALDLDLASAPVRRLTDRLPLGTIEPLGLPYESYQLALTDAWLEQTFGREGSGGGSPWRVDAAKLIAAGYHEEPDLPGMWWIPSGQQQFAPQQFYLATVSRNPFGGDNAVTLDRYDLLTIDATDAVSNTTTAVNDYRILQPSDVVDPDGNRSRVAFDTMGFVVGGATMGRGEGDSLTGFDPDLEQADIAGHLADPLAHPEEVRRMACVLR